MSDRWFRQDWQRRHPDRPYPEQCITVGGPCRALDLRDVFKGCPQCELSTFEGLELDVPIEVLEDMWNRS